MAWEKKIDENTSIGEDKVDLNNYQTYWSKGFGCDGEEIGVFYEVPRDEIRNYG